MSEVSKDGDGAAQHTEVKAYDNYDGTPPARPTKRQRLKRHYRRFWWLHLFIFIAVTLVITLPLIYVGVPHIAQRDVNKSKLNITSLAQLNPTPTQFDLQLTSVLETHSQYHPTLDAFNGSMYLETSDTPFISFEIPSVKANNGAVSHINQTVSITNLDAYTEYAKTVLSAESYYVILKGRGGLKQSGLPKTTVNYHQNVTQKGLNGLKGLNVTNLEVLTTPLPDGSNMKSTITIPNPSVMTIAMGNVTLNLFVDGTPIGFSTLPDLTLRPGNNVVQSTSTLNQTAVISLLEQTKYKSGILPVSITGNRTTYNGQDLSYYDAALKSNTVQVNLNAGQALANAGLGGLLGFGGSSTTSSSPTATAA